MQESWNLRTSACTLLKDDFLPPAAVEGGQERRRQVSPERRCEEIRLRAYEIYLERDSIPGNELDDWLKAEHELDGRAPQERESTHLEEHKP